MLLEYGALKISAAIESALYEGANSADLKILDPLKTGRLVVVDEAPGRGSWASEVAALLGELAFDYLDAPITRVTAPNTPVPFAPTMERFYVPSEERIAEAVCRLF